MLNQRGVATLTRGCTRKRAQITQALGMMPEGATPAILSRETGLNVNTIKTLLPKMENVKRVTRGWYKVAEGGDGTPVADALSDWNFHNLVLTGVSDQVHIPAASFDFGLGRVDVAVVAGKGTLRLSSDWPLNVSSIAFVAWVFSRIAGVSSIMVSTVEFNRDFSNLRLDGVKSISVDSLISQFKAYQKDRGLRLEHKTKVPLSVENVVDMLAQPPLSIEANVKLALQSQRLEELTKATSQNTQILFKIIDRLRGERL